MLGLLQVKTSPVPVKHDYFAVLKSTNYLPNTLNLMDAEVRLPASLGRSRIHEHVVFLI